MVPSASSHSATAVIWGVASSRLKHDDGAGVDEPVDGERAEPGDPSAFAVGADQGIRVLVRHDGRYDGDAHDDKGGCDFDQWVRLGLASTAGSGEASAERGPLTAVSQDWRDGTGLRRPTWTPGKP
jgi:hypothetical protein